MGNVLLTEFKSNSGKDFKDILSLNNQIEVIASEFTRLQRISFILEEDIIFRLRLKVP